MTETIIIGGLSLEFLESKDGTEGSLDLFRMTVQAQAKVPIPHYHESWDETVYGLSGRLTFRVGTEEVAVEPGRSLFIKRGVVHGFSNPGPETAVCLSVLTPGVLGAQYFRDIAAEMATGAPDPARMTAIMLKHRLIPVPPGS
ncbi:quercetin dioxygenase-like cupin family protein [Rhodoligotrophos appendicifer]|uniref:cupin domain-containing protein n=1 Tax=Rhodoligotrophos appendicifer TaxID=987056 RepID=UPI001186DA4C|nr:cupin domain-containing protein [Rhodoligotrophos appendicifer]